VPECTLRDRESLVPGTASFFDRTQVSPLSASAGEQQRARPPRRARGLSL